MNGKILKLLEFDRVKNEILKYVKTEKGKSLVRDLSPFSEKEEVTKALNETSEAISFIKELGAPRFDGLNDIYTPLNKIEKGGTISLEDIYKIGTTLRCIREVKTYLGEKTLTYLKYYSDNITTFKFLEDRIFRAIKDGEEVTDQASPDLFKIRKELRSKTAAIKRKMSDILKSYSKYLQENIFTVRGDRYCIPVKAEYKSQVQGIVHNQSASGSTYFIEPLLLVNLNNEINELLEFEKEEVMRIFRELCMDIGDSLEMIYISIDSIYSLEFIFSKGRYALEIDGVKPEVSEDRNIYLISARHPLIPKDKVVPLNLNFGVDRDAIIITGPNTGGKTVTLKTLGLMHIMGLSGLFIPAYEGSEIMLLDEIYGDIGDEQSLEQNLSTFSSHITNIISIMNGVKDKTLILLDEVGSGTDPEEGAALAISIIEYFLEKGCKLMGTTHYSQLKTYAINSKNVENASVEFDIETLKPTYRLNVGIPGKSNAFIISEILGMDKGVLSNANKYLSGDTIKLEKVIKTLEEKASEAVKNNEEITFLKEENKILNEKLKKRLGSIDNEKEKILEEAKKEAEKIILDAKSQIDDTLKIINSLELKGIDINSVKDLESARRKIKKDLDEEIKKKEEKKRREVSSEVNYKSGMSAFFPRINQSVTLLENPDSKGNVLIQAGIMKLSVNVCELEGCIKEVKAPKVKKKTMNLKMSNTKTSLDLRGMDALNAISETEKYLDDAFMSGLNEVSIIHGKGTGILKKSITSMLRGHMHVKSYRLGEYGEGGDGVTIVYLK